MRTHSTKTCCMLAVLAAIAINVWAAATDEGGHGRDAWRFHEKGKPVTIYRNGEKQWTAERPDAKRPSYAEIERTDEYIELQNVDTKLFVRLHSAWSYWRQPKQEKWTRWAKGEWIDGFVPVDEANKTQNSPYPARKKPASPAKHVIQIGYFVPADRQPVRQYEAKIRVIAAIVSEVYQRSLLQHGIRIEAPKWETERGRVVVHLLKGERNASYYNASPNYDAVEQWRRLNPEIRAQMGDPRHQLMVVFAETYEDGPAKHLWPGVIARGAYYTADGGLAIYSGHLLRDEFCAVTLDQQRRLFFDRTPIPGRKAWGHLINSPRCEFVEDGLGAVAHELGHALGLPHDTRQDDREIMGNGFRNLRRFFDPQNTRPVGFSDELANLLMSSRYVARDLDVADTQPPKVEMRRTGSVGAWQTVEVSVSDDRGLRAIVFSDHTAGTVLSGQKLSGKSATLKERVPLRDSKGRLAEIGVIVTDSGGNQSRQQLDN